MSETTCYTVWGIDRGREMGEVYPLFLKKKRKEKKRPNRDQPLPRFPWSSGNLAGDGWELVTAPRSPTPAGYL